MRQPQNQRRGRGRGGRKPSGRNQTFDSNGPQGRIRGNAQQVHEKYLSQARDAASAGDRILSENLFQHADHYFRIMLASGIVQTQSDRKDDQQDGSQPDQQASDDQQGRQRRGRMNGKGEQDHSGDDYRARRGDDPDSRGDADADRNQSDERRTSDSDDDASGSGSSDQDAADADEQPARPKRGRPRKKAAAEQKDEGKSASEPEPTEVN